MTIGKRWCVKRPCRRSARKRLAQTLLKEGVRRARRKHKHRAASDKHQKKNISMRLRRRRRRMAVARQRRRSLAARRGRHMRMPLNKLGTAKKKDVGENASAEEGKEAVSEEA
jgi:hypothetical protein